MRRLLAVAATITAVTVPSGTEPASTESTPTPQEFPTLRSTAAQRDAVSITVYNQNFGLVREIRTLDLPSGRIALEYGDVASGIQPETVYYPSDRRWSAAGARAELPIRSAESPEAPREVRWPHRERVSHESTDWRGRGGRGGDPVVGPSVRANRRLDVHADARGRGERRDTRRVPRSRALVLSRSLATAMPRSFGSTVGRRLSVGPRLEHDGPHRIAQGFERECGARATDRIDGTTTRKPGFYRA